MSGASARRHEVIEVRLGPASEPVSPAARVEVFIEPGGRERRVPAFASRGDWRVRYASSAAGEHRYRVDADQNLADPVGAVYVLSGDTPQALSGHGPLRVADGRRHLEHADGTPLLWLADTWWDGLTRRLTPEQFRELAARRVEQGFSVVQLVAGLYPEMAAFASEGESVSGWCWQEGFAGPNPEWFDEADLRVAELVSAGLVPCIVGAWGFYVQHMGTEKMLRHWRELIARWGAYPVVWCLAGEMPALEHAVMRAASSKLERGSVKPADLLSILTRQISLTMRRRGRARGFPDSEGIAALLGLRPAVADQVRESNVVLREVRRMDPFDRVLTVHSQPNWPPYELVEDRALIDLWMLQTGHSGIYSLTPSVNQVEHALAQRPPKPVLVGEVDYEGILGSSGPKMQRFLFWSHMLSGTAGHSYGAQGLWGFNTSEYQGGEGGRWNDLTWQQAAALPGATHVGIGRKILLKLPWQSFESHPEWVKPHQHAKDRIQPYAGGITNGPRVVYFPAAGLGTQLVGLSRRAVDPPRDPAMACPIRQPAYRGPRAHLNHRPGPRRHHHPRQTTSWPLAEQGRLDLPAETRPSCGRQLSAPAPAIAPQAEPLAARPARPRRRPS
jgi:Protein of unknown function (DUF4038)